MAQCNELSAPRKIASSSSHGLRAFPYLSISKVTPTLLHQLQAFPKLVVLESTTKATELALFQGFLMASPSQTGRAAAQIDCVCSDVSEMRGVLELQAMLLSDLARRENEIKGFCKTKHSSHGQDLEKLKVDTVEALQKMWSKH